MFTKIEVPEEALITSREFADYSNECLNMFNFASFEGFNLKSLHKQFVGRELIPIGTSSLEDAESFQSKLSAFSRSTSHSKQPANAHRTL